MLWPTTTAATAACLGGICEMAFAARSACPECRHADHRGRRHFRQPHGVPATPRTGWPGECAARNSHPKALFRRAGRGDPGARGRDRNAGDAGREHRPSGTAISSARPPAVRQWRASCRVARHQGRCSAPDRRSCTRSGTGRARRSRSCATTRPVRCRTCRSWRPGLRPRPARGSLTFDPPRTAAPYLNLSCPNVAIMREQGVNSHVEMSYARFTEAGFDAVRCATWRPVNRPRAAGDCSALVACGGFAMATRWAPAIGWARSHLFNHGAGRAVRGFQPGHLRPGVCNGCQMMSWPASSRRRGRASPGKPQRAVRRRGCRWGGAGQSQPVLRRHGPAAGPIAGARRRFADFAAAIRRR